MPISDFSIRGSKSITRSFGGNAIVVQLTGCRYYRALLGCLLTVSTWSCFVTSYLLVTFDNALHATLVPCSAYYVGASHGIVWIRHYIMSKLGLSCVKYEEGDH